MQAKKCRPTNDLGFCSFVGFVVVGISVQKQNSARKGAAALGEKFLKREPLQALGVTEN